MRNEIHVALVAPRNFEEKALIEAFRAQSDDFLEDMSVILNNGTILHVFIGAMLGIVICGLRDGQGQDAAREQVEELLNCDDSRLKISLIVACGTAGAHGRLNSNDGLNCGDIIFPISVSSFAIASIGDVDHRLRGMRSIPEEKFFLRPVFAHFHSDWIERVNRELPTNEPIQICGYDFASSAIKICNEKLANDMLNVGGTEAYEMEFLGIFQAVKDSNIQIDMVKGISDFPRISETSLGNENVTFCGKDKAARNSAVAIVALLSIQELARGLVVRNYSLPTRRRNSFKEFISTIYESYRNDADGEAILKIRDEFSNLGSLMATEVCRELDEMFDHVCAGCGRGLSAAHRVLENMGGLERKIKTPDNVVDVPIKVIRIAAITGRNLPDWLDAKFLERVISYEPSRAQAQKYKSLLQTLLHFRIFDNNLSIRLANRAIQIAEEIFPDLELPKIMALSCRLCVYSRQRSFSPHLFDKATEEIRKIIDSSSLPKWEKEDRRIEIDQRALTHKILIFMSNGLVAESKCKALCKSVVVLQTAREKRCNFPSPLTLGLSYLKWLLSQDDSSAREFVEAAASFKRYSAQIYHCLYDLPTILLSAKNLEFKLGVTGD